MPEGDGNQGGGGANPPDPNAGGGGANPPDPNAGNSGGDGGNEPLREEGKRALESERAARQAAEREAKAAKDEAERLRKEHQSEEEKAIEAARAEGRKEVEGAANGRIVRAELTAAAGGKLADPTDAPRYLDTSKFEVADDGSVDRKAMASAIDDLVKDKPYLAAKRTSASGDAGGGPQGDPAEGGPNMDDWIRERAKGR